MDISKIREDTAKALGVDLAEVAYIDEELMRSYQASAKPADTASGDADGNKSVAGNWGTYGNSITFAGDLVYWKQGPKGTPNYGCGQSETWRAGKDWCRWIIPKGNCGSYPWKFLGNYQG